MDPAASTRPTAKQTRPLRRERAFAAAARSFFLVLFVISILTVWSFLSPVRQSSDIDPQRPILKRDLAYPELHDTPTSILRRDEECRFVHTAEDQCAFVRRNCPDEEAGLLSYLQLYYCRLPNARPVAFVILVLWLGLLFSTIGIAASDFFCVDLSTIASILGMSESMAGVTFLAFGNGSPDVFSTFAAMRTHSGSLAIGELIGAAGFISSVVAGSMALVRPFKVARKSFVRDVGFFVIAASFSMVFLADGHLHLWECAAMVGFYVFYVAIVLLWHWRMKRRSRQRTLENAARSHFHVPSAEGTETEPYHDEEDEEVAATARGPSRTISNDDFNNLERASSPLRRLLAEEADADDDTRGRYLAEINNNMRVNRPKRGERRSTMNPIRPSLVGALEFRAVLSSLHKSRNIQTTPIILRRYSDDPAFALSQTDRFSSPASIAGTDYHEADRDADRSDDQKANSLESRNNRARAKSTNDAGASDQDSEPLQRLALPQLGAIQPRQPAEPDRVTESGRPSRLGVSPSPLLSVSPAVNEAGYLTASPIPMTPTGSPPKDNFLAPPGSQHAGHLSAPDQHLSPDHASGSASLSATPRGRPTTPRLEIPSSNNSSQKSSPVTPFPAYHDDPNFIASSSRAASIALPPPSVDAESSFRQRLYGASEDKPLKWWPYKVLPSPQVLASTLFPTLYSWSDKNIWEKTLGVVAAPSVFLFAVTLPVVEVDKDDEIMPAVNGDSPYADFTKATRAVNGSTAPANLPPDSPTSTGFGPSAMESRSNLNPATLETRSPVINITSPPEQESETLQGNEPAQSGPEVPSLSSPSLQPSSFRDWNRWLVIVQIFTAPLIVMLLVHFNMEGSHSLLIPTLITLIGSLTASVLLILLTSPDRAPKYRYLFCFVGFVVSIAWISTIAGEVVGVLKALGIILNISDAILGLTIFAVGNSLGDLVADITVAKLGYPVMALSACFGGPMLNILLGIGLSGLYMTITGGERRHAKHPDEPVKYKPYQIEVGGTLIISGVALLVTLLGLLIVVPLRGWWMDRRVGIGLVTLWAVSTIGNVVVEVVGVT